MAFRLRKKNKSSVAAPAEEEQRRTPLTLIFTVKEECNSENITETFSSLPENAQVLAVSENDTIPFTLPEGRVLTVSPTRDAPVKGEYVMEADSTDTFIPEQAAALFGALCDAQTDVVFYGTNEIKHSAQTGDPLLKTLNGERPVPLHTAMKKELAQKANASGLSRKYREIFIPLLFAESAQSFPLDPYNIKKASKCEIPETEEIFALAAYFNQIKHTLPAGKYRFAFQYVCNELILAAAKLAAANDTNALTEFDARLKGLNMALWVAVAEKSPLSFMKSIRKKNYAVPVTIRAFLKGYFLLKK